MTAPDPRGFRALSVTLAGPASLDGTALPEAGLLALAGSTGSLYAADGILLAGFGTAAVLPLPNGLADAAAVASIRAWLAAVPSAGGPHAGNGVSGNGVGGRVVALGALPFDRTATGGLVVPTLTVGREPPGRVWATLVTTAERARPEVLRQELAAVLRAAGDVDGGPGGPTAPGGGGSPALTEVPPGAGYADAVAKAVGEIDAGGLEKVVLARRVDARFPGQLDLGRLVRRLRVQEPSCTTFSVPVDPGAATRPASGGVGSPAPGVARFVGASPELLVRRDGSAVTCHPLAGTIGLTGDAALDAAAVDRFLGSAKEHREHRLVVEAIAAVLDPLTTTLDVPADPSLVRLESVAHFGTLVRGTLSHALPHAGSGVGQVADDARPSVLDLVAALHPTPAVGGVPQDRALEAITRLEAAPRGLWAGPVGWMDAAGDGEWMIGLRSATVDGPVVHLHAGAGIVAGSEPAAELAETTVKLAPMLDALASGLSAAR